ncbi:MAG: preprotein translocase subunit YajC [Spirochaetia bacterium]|jgi:preprotein translocase subunit YajC|nr:preprotein translocase subunit YajC [Spirochaetales bacterium]MDX9783825.1 preprotein translocase subunit YajC [Spirochaetia bacterium]
MNSISQGLVLLQAAAGSSSGQMVSTLVTFGLVFVVFYFLIIRPQNKKQKEAKKMIEAVKKGDRIITIGGIHGIVHSVKETTVVVKVDDDCRIEFTKSALATVAAARTEEKAEEPAPAPEKTAKAEKAEKSEEEKK